eukprot:gene1150-4369_t
MSEEDLERCPGFCGRVLQPDLDVLDVSCGQCPRAHRSDGYICQPCTGSLSIYDILFLTIEVFMFCQLYTPFIQYIYRETTKRTAKITVSMFVCFELLLSLILTILSIEPRGSLQMHSCGVKSIRDWYSALVNPTPDYINTLHCSNEVAFPLVTFTLLFLGYISLITIAVRVPLLLSRRLAGKFLLHRSQLLEMTWTQLYFPPILGIVHVVLGGLLYYSFAFIVYGIHLIACIRLAVARNRETPFGSLSKIVSTGINFYALPFSALQYCLWQLLGPFATLNWIWVALGPLIPAILIDVTWRFTGSERFT